MSVIGGGLNRSTQHFILERKDGVYSDGSAISSWFQSGREDGVVDSLAERGKSLKAIGRAFSKPSSSLYCQVAPHGGDSSGSAALLAVGIDAFGARGDIQGHSGPSIGPSMARLLGRSPSTVSRNLAAIAAMIPTERRWLMRRSSCELVAETV